MAEHDKPLRDKLDDIIYLLSHVRELRARGDLTEDEAKQIQNKLLAKYKRLVSDVLNE